MTLMASFEWIGFNTFVLILLMIDLLMGRRSTERSVRQSLIWSALWILLALAFSGIIFAERGQSAGLEFLAAYVIEKSLSIDNIFAFYLVFQSFRVSEKNQHRILMWGVCGALIMRAIMIIAGSALVARYQWILYGFGAFLVWTGVHMLRGKSSDETDPHNNPLVVWLQKRIPLSSDNPHNHFFVRHHNTWHMTPLFLTLVLIELSDVVFAVDSIPAVFAISQDPYIIYTSNVFAILGLRALYFALSGMIERFQNLKTALSVVLILIGTKMLLAHWIHIPVGLWLLAIAGIVTISLLLPQKKAPEPTARQ